MRTIAMLICGATLLLGASADAGEYDNVQTLGVISAIGDSISLVETGFLGTEKHIVATPEWKIDQTIQQQIQDAVGQHFTVKSVIPDRQQLLELQIEGGMNGFDDHLKALMRSLATTSRMDAIAFVHKAFNVAYGEPRLRGLGIWHDGASLGISALEHTNAYANYEIEVFDSRTGRIMEAVEGSQPANAPSLFHNEPPREAMDNAIWNRISTGHSEAQLGEIKPALETLVAQSIRHTLGRTELAARQ